MMDPAYLQGLIQDEFGANEGYIEMSVEEWQREFDLIYQELN